MKPIRNRFSCKDCGRVKMLFETKKKADTFIKLNREEIAEETGNKPERSYFCAYCGGWHVTSNKEQLDIKSRTEKVLDLYEREKKQKAEAKAKALTLKREKEQEAMMLAQKQELERELKALAATLRERVALEKSQKREQVILLKSQEKSQKALIQAQMEAQKKEEKARKTLIRTQKKEQEEQESLIRARKINELRPILNYAEFYIRMLERLSLRAFNPNSVILLDRVTEELEKAKSIGISYKKSEKRIARIEERTNILRNKYKK